MFYWNQVTYFTSTFKYRFLPNISCFRISPRQSTMTSSYKFLLLLLRITSFCLVVVGSDPNREQKFAMEPQDQTAVVGSKVTLPCRVIGKSGILQWTKDDFGLGTHRNLSGFERYSMVGSDEEGNDFDLFKTFELFILFSIRKSIE